MVFFVCDGCNETLKKNQVDRHASRCKQCYAVTCMDCNHSFPGNEYAAHTTCVTEAEKYQKSLYQGKAKNKLSPQDLWAATIQEASDHAETAPSNIRHFLPIIAECGNVPRNKNKFINFAKNSLKLNSAPVLESIWTFIETFKPAAQAPSAPVAEAAPVTIVTKPTIEIENQEEVKEKKKKKKKSGETEEEVTVSEPKVETETKEKKKKKKKSAEAEPMAMVEEVQEQPQEMKKRKVEKEVQEPAEEISAEVVKEKKSKKKKSRTE
jgi:cell growth-regulating nucleolar protein